MKEGQISKGEKGVQKGNFYAMIVTESQSVIITRYLLWGGRGTRDGGRRWCH